jgi:hypothetical protein
VPGPFYNCIKGTTSGTPGTGAFTPNAASSGFRAWSTVPTGWIGLVRYEDGTSWELTYSYWNGTTLSRASTQLYDSSSGSALSLTSAATAAMVADANEIGGDFTSLPVRGSIGNTGTTSMSNIGVSVATATGTGGAGTLATTNYLTRQPRVQLTSATTASARAGWASGAVQATVSSSAGLGGYLFSSRFGCSALPTGPRVFVGMTATTFSNAAEPSALAAAFVAVAKDSTDSNLQFVTNDGTGSGTKIDTGIALAANGWYEVSIWQEPGSLTCYLLLIRLDTGAIYYGSTATDVPVTNSTLFSQVEVDLNATNTGTAVVLHISHMLTRPVM